MNGEQKALVERWRSFLDKIAERQEEIIAEATAGCAQLAAQHPVDSLPLSNALSGLDHRIRQLDDRIEETWEQQVEDKFSSHGSEFFDVGIDMRKDAEMALEHRWQTAKAKIVADHARSLYQLALAKFDEQPMCERCGAPIQPASRTISETIACGACGAQNSYQPAMEIQMYRGAGAHALAEEASLGLRQELERWREEVDRWRRARDWAPEPLESLEQWRAKELACWQRYAEEKAKLLGEPVDQAYVDSRMQYFDKYQLHMNQIWVKAHGKG
ncbi:MAG: hypothetical protein CMN30_16370 [Sandaracinus sp.]|nr:hypothetical protein [Sandaracinus sp.]